MKSPVQLIYANKHDKKKLEILDSSECFRNGLIILGKKLVFLLCLKIQEPVF
jgi:hypothetical protein